MLSVGRPPAMPGARAISSVVLLPLLALPARSATRLAPAPALRGGLQRLAVVLREGELLWASALLLGAPSGSLCRAGSHQTYTEWQQNCTQWALVLPPRCCSGPIAVRIGHAVELRVLLSTAYLEGRWASQRAGLPWP